jgi:hypothetical protein
VESVELIRLEGLIVKLKGMGRMIGSPYARVPSKAIKSLLIFAVLLLVDTSIPRLALAGGVENTESQADFTLPFEVSDNRVFVDVWLNGKGPFHFILDTGAEAALSERAAQQLELNVVDAGEGQGVGATKQHFGRAQLAVFRLGSLELKDLEIEVISLADTPQVFGTRPVDGVIGGPVFELMTVKQDYIHRELTFTRSDRFHYAGSGTILRFERPQQIPVIEAKLDGVAGNFGVDTGARSALLLYRPFCEQNRLAEKYGAKFEGVTGWGIGGPVRSLLARANKLTLGTIDVRSPVIRLSTQKSGLTLSPRMAGLIGPDVLSQFNVTFDYARRRIILETNRDYGRRDSYDRAGLWMGQKDGHFTAVDVISGGPADEAGVRLGDVILAIDGKDTGGLVLPDVRESMRRRSPGEKVSLLLESHGAQRIAVVTLRDLV